ncbi:CDGP domain-containing protein [Mycobacterium servetii]|uniref:CDGP domain-containing protein n=1 Tax=Mycobacterium servetii TaxID=3237418 RepID=A0ABV4C5M0_9MYCO
MNRGIVGGLTALLLAAELVASAPPAQAGCVYGGGVISKCDGPVQPDGTWQRCVAVPRLIPSGASSFLVPDGHCDEMGPGQPPADPGFADPPTHIDD